VFAPRVIEPLDRTECRIFFRSAVERARECGRDRGGRVARGAFDFHRLLQHARAVEERIERHVQMRLTRRDDLAHGNVGRDVVAVAIVHAHALCIAIVVALHFERVPVLQFVHERGRVDIARPRAPGLFLPSHAVERRDDRARDRRLARFVWAVDDVEPVSERERAIGDPAEAGDRERAQLHVTISRPSNALVMKAIARAASGSSAASSSATARPRTFASRAIAA
jgi:hypothetical protein